MIGLGEFLQRLVGVLDQAALRRSSQFNVIDLATGWKADLIVRKWRRFSAEEFRRRERVRLFDVDLWMATPEDVVLSKLEWADRMGGSERQLRDVRAVVARNPALDLAYLDTWAADLGVAPAWRQIRPSGATP